jgi:hypothetical protein
MPSLGLLACDTAAVNRSVATAFMKALAASEATAPSSLPCNCCKN